MTLYDETEADDRAFRSSLRGSLDGTLLASRRKESQDEPIDLARIRPRVGITLRPPWGARVALGDSRFASPFHKGTESRIWIPSWKRLLRGDWIAIHSGKTPDFEAELWLEGFLGLAYADPFYLEAEFPTTPPRRDLFRRVFEARGATVAVARFSGVRRLEATSSDSRAVFGHDFRDESPGSIERWKLDVSAVRLENLGAGRVARPLFGWDFDAVVALEEPIPDPPRPHRQGIWTVDEDLLARISTLLDLRPAELEVLPIPGAPPLGGFIERNAERQARDLLRAEARAARR